MERPITYLQRTNRKNPKYLFVSYSHKDIPLVDSMLSSLFDLGANYWYDINLSPGDTWDVKVAEEIIKDTCSGALIFLSINSLKSEAVFEEIKLLKNKREKYPDFFIIPVLLDNKVSNLKELYTKTVNEDTSFWNRNSIFSEVLDQEKKTFVRNDNDSINSIYRVIKKYNVVENSTITLNEERLQYLSNYKLINKKHCIDIGYFPVENKGEKMIRWQLIYEEYPKLYFISEFCLDFVTKKNIARWIFDFNKLFEGYLGFLNIQLINENLLSQCFESIGDTIPTDYADTKRSYSLRLFWYKNKDGNLEIMNSKNRKPMQNINLDNIDAGIRPILIIDDSKIEVNNG